MTDISRQESPLREPEGLADRPARRREQIAQAALDLLATTPLSELSTRAIARRVGISQPGLFRHFLSRDAIVLAALDRVRDQLAQVAAAAVDPSLPPQQAIDGLIAALGDFAVENPGVPRLLFSDLGGPASSPFRPALAHLLAMQQALLAELIGRAVAAGVLPVELQREAAARLLLGLVQGVLLQWLAQGGPDPRPELGRARELWWAGVKAGAPSGTAPPPPARVVTPALHLLDVRPILKQGQDPLGAILAALDGQPPLSALALLVPFRPAPLIALLRARGLSVSVVEGPLVLVLVHPPELAVHDLRELPAPEPMEALLVAAEGLSGGAALLALTPRLPALLLAELDRRGFAAQALSTPDGCGLVRIAREG